MADTRHFAPGEQQRLPRPAAVALLGACHPAPTATVTVIAVALAAAAGRSLADAALVGAAVLAGQLSVGWCNDRVDLRRDQAAGRRDKPLAAGAVRPGTVSAAAGAALASAVPLSLAASGPVAGGAHLLAVAAAWAYDLGVKRTGWSWLPYVLAFGLLPVFAAGHRPPWWAMAAGALLGLGAHAANVLPDIPDDLAAGVRGLPQRLGPRAARLLAVAALLAASAVLLFAPPGPHPWYALLLPVALLLPLRGRRPFAAVLALALLDVALLLLRGTAL
ncbi:UbiA family prenyltransferase [Kitasatospora sp. NPDC002227]|uniref:UbiA family prenyltransferase n=1 Tax=Kitasatospora sp. NPDC002227 TaxID=3154773 RepID=UPI00332707C4